MATTLIIAGILVALNVAERIVYAEDFAARLDLPNCDFGQADGGR